MVQAAHAGVADVHAGPLADVLEVAQSCFIWSTPYSPSTCRDRGRALATSPSGVGVELCRWAQVVGFFARRLAALVARTGGAVSASGRCRLLVRFSVVGMFNRCIPMLSDAEPQVADRLVRAVSSSRRASTFCFWKLSSCTSVRIGRRSLPATPRRMSPGAGELCSRAFARRPSRQASSRRGRLSARIRGAASSCASTSAIGLGWHLVATMNDEC